MPRIPTFKREVLDYLQSCSDRLLSSKSLETYRQTLMQIDAMLEGKGWPQDPKKWEPRHVREFYESQQHLATSTQKLRMTILLGFLKHCENAKTSKIILRIKVARTNVDWLTPDKVGLLLHTAPDLQTLATETLISYTGMRIGEVASLRHKDVHEDYVQVRGKGAKARNIPIDRRFWERIMPYLAKRPKGEFFVMKTYHAKLGGYPPHSLTRKVADHAAKLGFHCSPHTLRRTFGREMFFNGCPLPILKELLGHSTVEMTIRYLGIMDSDIQGAVRDFLPEYGQKTYLKPPAQQDKEP